MGVISKLFLFLPKQITENSITSETISFRGKDGGIYVTSRSFSKITLNVLFMASSSAGILLTEHSVKDVQAPG